MGSIQSEKFVPIKNWSFERDPEVLVRWWALDLCPTWRSTLNFCFAGDGDKMERTAASESSLGAPSEFQTSSL